MIWGDAAHAGGTATVTACTLAGFTAGLTTLSGGGGLLLFNCTSSPATITFNGFFEIDEDIVIDGGNLVTFDGNNTSAFFKVDGGHSLTLKRLTLRHGAFNGAHALENRGTLNLSGVTVTNNISTQTAILNYGSLLIASSNFSFNVINDNGSGAALLNAGGDVQIVDAFFNNNGIFDRSTFENTGRGGAIANASGSIQIYSSTFDSNYALEGGAIEVEGGTLSISNSLLTSNNGSFGGAVENFNGSAIHVSNSDFTYNHALGAGGAIWNRVGTLDLDRSQFTGNTATGNGGAIDCLGSGLSVVDSAFASNTTAGNGAAIFSSCALSVINATFNQNYASSPTSSGGAVSQAGVAAGSVMYATIAGNTAATGAGIYNDSHGSSLTLSRSILTGNGSANCAGALSTGGYNLSNDTSCGFFGVHDQGSATVPLGAFGNYGGATWTMLPLAGSQAINFVPNAQCSQQHDQRGYVRPAPGNSACDSGAVELNGIVDEVFGDGFEFR